MKRPIIYVVLIILIVVSCNEKKEDDKMTMKKEAPIIVLPFQAIGLNDMDAFKEVSENWKIVGNVYADKSKAEEFTTYGGSGVLVNNPTEGYKDNLYTAFEHGDMELELDVMLQKSSNSGLYFQSRYEVQLFDSWGVQEPGYVDMGGIYERWDASKEKGQEGYEGHSPKTNATKAPGLWQHIKVIFHAPKFDASGNKVKNAWFEEVWLNGVLIHEHVEVTGPTRAAAFEDEKPMAPLMIQGDHGPVAFKNVKYKLYADRSIGLKNMILKAYDSPDKYVPGLDSLEVRYARKTDSISPVTVVDRMGKTILEYTGTMDIPDSGEYLFDMKVDGGATLLVDNDTLINMNGDYRMDSLGLGKITLKRGAVPFKLVYNKHTPWRRGFEFYVEGPEMQRYSVQQPSVLTPDPINTSDFVIDVKDEPIAQRSFWMHEGAKRTHCISVGTPQGIHYTYDLEAGSLLQLWDGDFMDATQMWLARGEKQLGAPRGFIVSIHGDPEFAFITDENSVWPDNLTENPDFKQLGYEFDAKGVPTFMSQIESTKIINRFVPSEEKRMMQRMLTVDGDTEIWYKIADGETITALPDGTFIINSESYFIDFSENASLKPIIRSSNGKDELLVKIPSGKQNINYTIIW